MYAVAIAYIEYMTVTFIKLDLGFLSLAAHSIISFIT